MKYKNAYNKLEEKVDDLYELLKIQKEQIDLLNRYIVILRKVVYEQ